MENEMIKLAMSQGIWAVISVSLLFYILKNQEKRDEKQEEREKNYQDIISKMSDKLIIVEDIKKDVGDVKDYIIKNKNFI
ncbi:BhlA/UviB family holin-like peptide [Clostridium sp. UBA1056]|uniref:BhlA/UviB family holin-like peptide n=1 Tax=unclassified Clostridium TaxID=2614128 RepID=UPI00321710B5